MTTNSALYYGTVVHRRLRPRRHQLRYGAFWMLLDLDEIDELNGHLRLFSRRRFNAMSFYDTDHGEETGEPLRQQIERYLGTAGIALNGGAIRLLCMPRIFGYGFNPLSLYFCYRPDGALAAILYEVHNTVRGAAQLSDPGRAGSRRGNSPKLRQMLLRVAICGHEFAL